MLFAHLFTTFSASIRNGTYLSSGEATKETVVEFNTPLETSLADSPAEFMPPADQSPKVTDRPPQVINDSTAVIAGGDGGTDEDDKVM